tara:strand:+ start:768 stop:1634 length:867 start_codon:yes stop_codon:yes gene_type:complete
MSKNILVTGGSGFIGSHVVDALLKRKYKVTIFDLETPKRKDVKFIKGSLLNKDLVKFALKKINSVFHLAAVSDINKVKSIPVKTVETNILGTTIILEASRNLNVDRFIFAGSVYSYSSAGNLYTTSKTASELIIKNYQLLFGRKFTILRYATAFGPRNRNVDAISIFVKKALKNQDLVIHGNGQQKRNYVYVEDLAEGSMIALKEKTKNKIITLASNQNVSIFNLAKIIIKLTKSKSRIIFDKKNRRIDDFDSYYIYNKKNLSNSINWKPRNDLKNGLRKYITEKYKI